MKTKTKLKLKNISKTELKLKNKSKRKSHWSRTVNYCLEVGLLVIFCAAIEY